MAISRVSAAASILSTVAVGALLVGCSSSSTPQLSADKLATKVAEMLAAEKGLSKPQVTCPEDLVGKVGTTTRCTLTADDGSTLGVTVTVKSVDGSEVNITAKADDTVTPAPSSS
ncbi:DUF4333 domain-containing protein [Streptomyces sp. XD-27]|uniref:DUF4333 domain-containing protein n=1 Tax=Streptomyces sp. XD-27 TaxID=3062779 RepID=UPI0026F42E99|nr:DUF4333 domain-containing protein [Streptomyces sp. XD-27]WKX69396.1 DUF4333 domain-containing protein [Streptomyces sp. XD-27]